MVDFLMISTRSTKRGVMEIYPKFIIRKSSDLMIRGGDFYAIWIEERGLWSTDEQDALQLIDRELDRYAEENRSRFDSDIKVLHMWDAESGMIDNWHKYCQRQMRDSFRMLDEKLIFSNQETKKEDYASKRLSYPLQKGDLTAYDRLMSVLYSPEERRKIEWAVGSIVSGASKKLQKFMVLYGSAGTGKGTVLGIVKRLFDGYDCTFEAKSLGSANSAFALEAFRSNPLVAIQYDGDLSRIEDNTRINSLVSHEEMIVNEKFKSAYSNSFKCFLFMGTNKPVKITDAKSGLIRRLIDVSPTGEKLGAKEYENAVRQIDFELGAIAFHCQEVYLSAPHAYDNYIPIAMLGASNDFYNFVMDSYHVFKKQDGVTLKAAWEMYKVYCEDAKVPHPHSQRIFAEELKNYFHDYEDRAKCPLEDGTRPRRYYSGFRTEKFGGPPDDDVEESKETRWLSLGRMNSIFDSDCADCPAQYASDKETPLKRWNDVTTTLSQLDTSRLHYVMVPENHIVIDFDIPDETGKKSLERNLEAANKWPPTYAELSKSGAAIHLHYIYSGDPSMLSRIYEDHIEVKVFTGASSLRRKLTECNNLPIASISSGLPLKGEKSMVNMNSVKSEKGLRTLIMRNLNKEIHPGTKPSIDFIYKILEDAYSDGLNYDVTDMRNAVLAFAAGSTHQADYCIKLANKMRFKSAEASEGEKNDEAGLVFYDVEVFPNLFLVNWKIAGEGKPVVRMINPTPAEIEELMRFRLVGFNCRRYDNHILYARLMGYTNEQLYNLSQKIVSGSPNCFFGEAYNVSYTDVYDFSSKKQSLKKFEIELGLHHQELGLPWDKPVPEELWMKVAEYCDNDVIATEATFNARSEDWKARQILADLSGGSVNDTTNMLTTRLVFGNERNPVLVYTDLATGEQFEGDVKLERKLPNAFPGYEFKRMEDGKFHNMYRGTDVGFGGYVYAEPGMYSNVALLDVASMHPTSIVLLNKLGKYTEKYDALRAARVFIKHHDYASAGALFDGKLKKYLENDSEAEALSKALKLPLNAFFGISFASYENPARDTRDKNNIIALRGALFMRTLQDEITARGFTVAHIKTDSVKIPDATPEIINFVMEFGKKYGYTFEHEATYDRMCLVNDAVYIAKYKDDNACKRYYGYIPEKNAKKPNKWTATGTQFAVPYVFKKLFSKEEISFEDMCETKSVSKGALYLDMNEALPDVSTYEKELIDLRKRVDPDGSAPFGFEEYEAELLLEIEAGHDYHFIGSVGQFCPVKQGAGGGLLVREKDGKYAAVTGTKGYRWMESEMVKTLEY